VAALVDILYGVLLKRPDSLHSAASRKYLPGTEQNGLYALIGAGGARTFVHSDSGWEMLTRPEFR